MITAVDTNILLDILIPDETHFQKSKKLLDEHLGKGQLIIAEAVYAELSSQFPSKRELNSFLADTGIKLVHSSAETLWIAGERWKEYTGNKKRRLQCPQCGKNIDLFCSRCNSNIKVRQHILSDFIIGSHAIIQAELLISRDRGFYRKYFNELEVIR